MKSSNIRSLLLVEDEDDLREVVMEMVESIGIDVQGAADGREALDIIQQSDPWRFQAVLSDIQMPRMSGLELLGELHKQAFAPPIVMLTAYGDKEKILHALRLGVFDFLEKPFGMNELKEVLSRAVDFGVRKQRLESDPSLTGERKMMALLQLVNDSKRKKAAAS